ncbi:rod shape-determining protein MreD [Pusillimonas sp. T2]|uniref:rod shape-determining protein MreD n=1 Tax=Pusillimonas sp. T2 TaxID=1548123 RepID=UPI000B9D271C|nr:rod shape-determining protein MreD [Pusillimonas sp. T2]OXR49974.1 rod shape-determining protein MreD [Pusillimonas sp. T2]
MRPSNTTPRSLSSLQPLDTRSFGGPASIWLVWTSILLVWVVSLLSWRLWLPAPDLLLLVIAFWCLYEPRRVGLFTAFVFGLLMDVHDAGPLGGQALVYGLVAYGTVVLSRRLARFNAVVQALHLLPVFVVSEAVYALISAWLAGQWVGWSWFWSALFTVALWPIAYILLHYLPNRLHDEVESGTA